VYNYDAANRLKEVGVSNTYGYDGDGMRVRQSSGGAKMFNVACGSGNGLFDFPFIIFHFPFVIV